MYMKKLTSILMILLLIISTVGPLPTIRVTAAVDFPGSASYLVTVDSNNKGTVNVTMSKEGYEVALHKHKDNDIQEPRVSTLSSYTVSSETPFPDTVDPGKYYLRAVKAGEEPKISADILVVPQSLSVGTASVNIVSPTVTAYTLTVTGVTGTEVRLYDNNNHKQPIHTLNTTNLNTVKFDNLVASKYYQVTQVINGAESVMSEHVTVQPTDVTIEKQKDSGPNNDKGEILVKNVTPGNTLILYLGGTKEKEVRANSLEYTFKDLKAGIYRVEQVENGVPSKKHSNEVIIKNEQIPNISLTGGENYELRYTINASNVVTKQLYTEPGYSVSYKNGKTYNGTAAGTFCEESTTAETGEVKCTSQQVLKVEISDAPPIASDNGVNYTPPGIYTITYKATDLTDINLTSSITRNIKVYPNKLNVSKVDTNPAVPNETVGKITVHGVYPGATVILYQDSEESGKPPIEIKRQPNINGGSYTFTDIKVGDNYFAVQEIFNVASEESSRSHIVDKTPPVLKLTGDAEITLEVGDRYIESGAIATDNIDTSEELAGKIQIVGTVNTNLPGVYTITYNVKDKAGNDAVGANGEKPAATRIVYVKPRPVTAIGGIATTGEIGVKDIFKSTATQPTTLQVYKYNDVEEKFILVTSPPSKTLYAGEVTQLLKKYGPGRYYVTQTVNKQESRQSNIVEIVDTDRPYITLNGLETVELVLGENLDPYYEDMTFTDPGATADDYLEAIDLKLSATLIGPNKVQIGDIEKETGKEIKFPSTLLKVPGTYKITYTATAPRGSVADPKHRIIKLAPPKVIGLNVGSPGEGKINIINGLFSDPSTKTTVTLYNTYGQKMESQEVIPNSKTAHFTDVPAGLGYYVTQTVNGIESAPSISVNVSLHGEAEKTAIITSFEFSSLKAVGIIDQAAGTITITVPKGTDRTKLAPTIQAIGTVSPNSGVAQNFSSPVTYTVTVVTDTDVIDKTYQVTVTEGLSGSENWGDSIKRNFTIGTLTLSTTEKIEASIRGISFLSSNLSIYVPASNVKESKIPTLSIQQPGVNTIYTPSDPSWKTTIANPVEIEWGGETSFYQPIEVELNNISGKVFAKLVRNANNQLYAIVQPSYTASGKIIGLVSEPGLYALIEDVAKPYIQDLGNGNYQIHPLTTGADIYYTTHSQDITYGKPATSTSGNYLLNSSNINLNEWEKYTPGETLTVSSNELYAVAVKNQLISPVSTFQASTYTSWGNNVKQVSTDKIWTVTFNAIVDKKAIYTNSIYVTDDTTGATVPTTLTLGADGKSIDIVPNALYERNKQYTLWVTKQIKGNTLNNQFLVQPTKITFTVK